MLEYGFGGLLRNCTKYLTGTMFVCVGKLGADERIRRSAGDGHRSVPLVHHKTPERKHARFGLQQSRVERRRRDGRRAYISTNKYQPILSPLHLKQWSLVVGEVVELGAFLVQLLEGASLGNDALL
ncbi:hypothetical protein GQ600_13643 [Phytophthora cactorum]|nr:hypothetical protein GQ600_13643 [Phytophthora cactorum]